MDGIVILTVKEPYASYLVDGLKMWEIRKRPVRYRGDVVIVTGGRAIGSVRLVDVLGPFDLDELSKFQALHRADPEFLREYAAGNRLFAWVMQAPERFDKPIPVEIIRRFEGPLRYGRLIRTPD